MMSVAMTAAERGHEVVLFDRASEVGGQLNMAKVIPGKEEFHGLVAWFETMVAEHGVALRLGRPVYVIWPDGRVEPRQV